MNNERLSLTVNVHAHDETELKVEEHGGIEAYFRVSSELGAHEVRLFLSDRFAARLAEELTDLVLLRKARHAAEEK